MADHKSEFTERLKRILHVSRKDYEAEERKWEEEQREKRDKS